MSATFGIALACLAFSSCLACYFLGREEEREKNRREMDCDHERHIRGREFNDDNFED